ncbi:MAG: RNA polymerase sigma factor [Flavobacteriales bacterium]
MKAASKYSKHSDEELMRLIGQRDSAAFEELYDRYSRLMYNYFHRMLWKDKEKARDFTQDLFSKLIHKNELFDEKRSFKTWLYSIAHNMCKNEYAKHEVRKDAHADIKYQQPGIEKSKADVDIDKNEFKRELQIALSELDEVKRTTFELRFYQEMSIQEISEIMECSEGTVKSRLFYTLKQLNEKLKAFEHILMWLMTYLMI